MKISKEQITEEITECLMEQFGPMGALCIVVSRKFCLGKLINEIYNLNNKGGKNGKNR